MNPLIPLGIIGAGIAVAVTTDAEASVPIQDDIGDDPFPIDHSDTGSTLPIDYGSDTQMDGDTNISAFLAVIREGESSGNYGALVGGGSFSDFSHHPATPPITFQGVGNSHAAGAYQFQPGTWASLGLPDFSPANQDKGAIMLLQRRGAYDDIRMGNIASAVGKLGQEWQMFLTTRWPVNSVIAHYEENGGYVA